MANLKSVYPAHPFLAYAQHLSLEGLLLQREAPERSIACWRFKSQYVTCCQSMCEYPYHFPKQLHVCVKLCVGVSIYLSIYLSIYPLWATINSLRRNEWWEAGVFLRAWTNLFTHRLVLHMYTLHDSVNYIYYCFADPFDPSLWSFHQQRTSIRFSF